MLDNYTINYLNLPLSVKGFTLYDSVDDYYTIVINCKYSFASMQKTLLHELKHIFNDDFHSLQTVAEIELNSH